MNDVRLWLVVCAILGAAYLIARSFDRRATKTIKSHTDAALLHGGEWLAAVNGTEDEDHPAFCDGDCLDRAADEAVALTRDGSRDSGELSTQEEFEWLEITRAFYREAS